MIEQALMKEIKTIGGLTHGRGLTESVIGKWVLSFITLIMFTGEIENRSMKRIVGSNFETIKFKRKVKLLSLNAINCKISVDDETEVIDPIFLFQRISLQIKKQSDMKQYLQFELALFPMSIFNDGRMRNTQKSVLYGQFLTLQKPLLEDSNSMHVIDGGFLLHKVLWHINDTIEVALKKHVDYVSRHSSNNSVIVFDGCPDMTKSVHAKNAKRMRRTARRIRREIVFDLSMAISCSQEQFLLGDKNKAGLITMLRNHLEMHRFSTKQAEEDANRLIVTTAIDLSQAKPVSIVREDVDLIVLITQLSATNSNAYFLKPGKGKTIKNFFIFFYLASNTNRSRI